MEINYLAVFGCAVLAMIVGYIWYGPIFGKQWAALIGADTNDETAAKEMQKSMTKLYVIQFLLVAFQVWVLSFYIKGAIDVMSGLSNALWIWAGFVIPTLAASIMWNGESGGAQMKRFLIQAGYQLIMLAIFGYILGNWA